MKKIPKDFLTFTEIGGIGEIIYKAVRFPEYVAEEDENGFYIKPLFSAMFPPSGGKDYGLTGQELLAGLINLYQKINNPNSSADINEAVRCWCKDNIQPYNTETICEILESDQYAPITMTDIIISEAEFSINMFLNDLCKLGRAFEFYFALESIVDNGDTSYAKKLYYEGRVCDGLNVFSKYSPFKTNDEYISNVLKDYRTLSENLVDLFPNFEMRLKYDLRHKKIEYGADIHSVFDIAWYTFARMVADTAPPLDISDDEFYSRGSILSCMACGEYFVRRSSNQRYCTKPDCQNERNRKNRRACYARKKSNSIKE